MRKINSFGSLHPVLQRIYAARHVHSLDNLDYSLSHLLHFSSLKDITMAAMLLAEAIQQGKHIVIVGDFDTDGATSTSLAMIALRQFGAHFVSYVVPNRFEYGYGLTPEVLALAKKPDLVMTVDNGISSYQGVLFAKEAGMQVIITDHHLPPTKLPPADAIVNPQQPGDHFASKNLAGVGVTFYVMLALRHALKESNWFQSQDMSYPQMDHLLDLVALGTVADMVPLDFNNRILVANGLERIRAGKVRPGIAAIAGITKCDLRVCTASQLGFSIAPKLNAAGRLQDMRIGIECLISCNREYAAALATQLDDLNKQRQIIEERMKKEAFSILKRLNLSTKQSSVCLFDTRWHEGITGLVAGRIKEHLHKPTAIFALNRVSGGLKGSVRSIPGINIRDVLAAIAIQHPTVLSHFGGHAAAAGLTLSEEHYQPFAALFESFVQKAMEEQTSVCTQQTDGELHETDLNVALALLIRDAGPWGQQFPEPLFEGTFHILSQRLVGRGHLQLTVKHPKVTRAIKAILFNADLEKWPNLRVQSVRLYYWLTLDEWEGRRDIKLQVQQIQAINTQ